MPWTPGALPRQRRGCTRTSRVCPVPSRRPCSRSTRAQTAGWVQRVADQGITDLWIHQQTDTPEALRLAKERGLRTEHGTCAVMYTLQGFHGHHSCHRWLNKLAKKY